MSISSRIGAASIALATAFGLGGCGSMTRGQSTGMGAITGAVVGGTLGGRLGAVLGGVAGGVAGNALGSDCQVRTHGVETRSTYGTQAGQYGGYQTRTMNCTNGVNISPNEAPPAGTVNGPVLRTPQGIVIR